MRKLAPAGTGSLEAHTCCVGRSWVTASMDRTVSPREVDSVSCYDLLGVAPTTTPRGDHLCVPTVGEGASPGCPSASASDAEQHARLLAMVRLSTLPTKRAEHGVASTLSAHAPTLNLPSPEARPGAVTSAVRLRTFVATWTS